MYQVIEIPLDQLEISEYNTRLRDITADLDALAYSMETFGLLQPIVVQPKGDKFSILVGQRRYFAAKQLRWVHITARVIEDGLDEFKAKVLSFSENIQRRDLSPRDKADACKYLLEKLGSPKAVAQHLGVTEQTVRKWLGYAAVPEGLRALVEQKKIKVPVATRIAEHVHDEARAVAIGEKIADLKPPKEARDRILEAVEEFPDRPLEVILEKAREKRVQKMITFVLPERWAIAIDTAAADTGKHPNDIAKDATVEWLAMRRYS